MIDPLVLKNIEILLGLRETKEKPSEQQVAGVVGYMRFIGYMSCLEVMRNFYF